MTCLFLLWLTSAVVLLTGRSNGDQRHMTINDTAAIEGNSTEKSQTNAWVRLRTVLRLICILYGGLQCQVIQKITDPRVQKSLRQRESDHSWKGDVGA